MGISHEVNRNKRKKTKNIQFFNYKIPRKLSSKDIETLARVSASGLPTDKELSISAVMSALERDRSLCRNTLAS